MVAGVGEGGEEVEGRMSSVLDMEGHFEDDLWGGAPS
jgi:hypothetical protein